MAIAIGLPLNHIPQPYRRAYKNTSVEMQTQRLWLRRWTMEDVSNFVTLRANAQVMEFFPARISPFVSIATIEEFEKNFDTLGYAFWVIESLETGEFVGTLGFYPRALPGGITQIAVGWQLMPEYWGKGYAAEAANVVFDYGFKRMKFKQIIAVIQHANWRSRQLAERLGMTLEKSASSGGNASFHSGECTYRLSHRAPRKNSR